MEKNDVLISVCTITYKHSNFIAKAIESVIAQQCSYKIEMIISDDCSPDNTADIIRSYAEKYPDIIKPIYNEKNLGPQKNNIQALTACKGKYIAGLEGDDYWIDPYKLQKQVSFLEGDLGYSVCVTDIEVLNEIGQADERTNSFQNFTKDTYTLEEFILPTSGADLLLPMATLVMRNVLPKVLPDFFLNAVTGDIALSLLALSHGKLKYLEDVTAVYREHQGGISKSGSFNLKVFQSIYDVYDGFNDYTRRKYDYLIRQRLYPLSKTLLMYGSSLLTGRNRSMHITEMLKGYKKYRPKKNMKEWLYFLLVLRVPVMLNVLKRIKK